MPAAAIAIDPDLRRHGRKITSQNDEDGIVAYLVGVLGIARGFCVEFGMGPPWDGSLERDGLEGNCRQLLEHHGWQGLLLDDAAYPPAYHVRQEFVTALNINGLLRKYRSLRSTSSPSMSMVKISGSGRI